MVRAEEREGREQRAGIVFGAVDAVCVCGQRVNVTDAVDTTLVKPRPRKYETAGAASATATSTGTPTGKRGVRGEGRISARRG